MDLIQQAILLPLIMCFTSLLRPLPHIILNVYLETFHKNNSQKTQILQQKTIEKIPHSSNRSRLIECILAETKNNPDMTFRV